MMRSLISVLALLLAQPQQVQCVSTTEKNEEEARKLVRLSEVRAAVPISPPSFVPVEVLPIAPLPVAPTFVPVEVLPVAAPVPAVPGAAGGGAPSFVPVSVFPVAPVPSPTFVPVSVFPIEPPTSLTMDTEAPTPAPAVTVCFSGNTKVETKERGSVLMKDLQVGDLALSRSGTFEKVYAFGHHSRAKEGNFLRLLPTGLELSKEHMVFIQGRGAIPASMVQVGDRFENGDEVSEIQAITQAGLYAPFTTSGTITVNNVAASCYISFQDSNVLVLGSWRTPITYQWLAHFFLTPHRIWCVHFGLEDSTRLEDSGISGWAQQGYTMAHWLLDQNQVVMSLILGVVALIMLFFSTVELLLLNPVLMVPLLGFVIISRIWSLRVTAHPAGK